MSLVQHTGTQADFPVALTKSVKQTGSLSVSLSFSLSLFLAPFDLDPNTACILFSVDQTKFALSLLSAGSFLLLLLLSFL